MTSKNYGLLADALSDAPLSMPIVSPSITEEAEVVTTPLPRWRRDKGGIPVPKLQSRSVSDSGAMKVNGKSKRRSKEVIGASQSIPEHGNKWDLVRATMLGSRRKRSSAPYFDVAGGSTHSSVISMTELQQKQTHVVSFVIPSRFLDDAQRESEAVSSSVSSNPEMPESHLMMAGNNGKAGGDVGNAAVQSQHWRRLVSPLVSFLTDVRNKSEWIQLAGHMGSFLPGKGGVICKKVGDLEKQAYEELMRDTEPLRDYVPLYFKEVTVNGEWYLELEDLLANFTNPNIMDIKMGVRTFLETEVTKKTLRKDLLAKMMAVDPNEATAEERENGITKLRYMEFREIRSSSRNLGFRIEGVKRSNEEPNTDFKTVNSREDAIRALDSFLPERGSALRKVVVGAFCDRLEDLRDGLARSDFFAHHEIIGSSLLFLYDQTGEAGIWIIDFGKTAKVENTLQHNVLWELGTREDGWLIGMNNLAKILNDDAASED